MISRASRVPLIARAERHNGRTALVDSQGAFTYNDLLDASLRVATALLAGREDLQEERVAFLVTPGFRWVATQWGIWRAGGIAVPLPLNSPRPELEYLIGDTGASILVFDTLALPLVSPITTAGGVRAVSYDHVSARQPAELPDITPDITGQRRALGCRPSRPRPREGESGEADGEG